MGVLAAWCTAALACMWCRSWPGEARKPSPLRQVHAASALHLRHQAWLNALRQYLQLLAGEAEVVGH